MRVGFFQFAPRFGEVSHNLDKVVETLDRADADLIVLPELCASGYQFVSQQEAITLSESVPDGPTTQRLDRSGEAAPDGDRRRSSGARRSCLL